MKKWFTLVAMALMAVGANAQELTVSDKQNSGCLGYTRGEDGDELPLERIPTILLQKEGNILSVELQNYTSNCATSDFSVKSSISEDSDGSPCTLSVNVEPVTGEELADCICPFNVSFTVRDLEVNSFYLKCWWYKGMVELTEGEPLVLEYKKEEAFIDGASYRLLKVMHTAMLMNWVRGEGELRIPSEVSYEGETYTVTCMASASFGEKVTKVFVPKTIRSMDFDTDGAIYSNPFAGCTSLESIEVDEDCPLFSSVDGVLFNKDKTKLIGYPAASPRETYAVPEWVSIVQGGAFCYLQHLRKLTIPDNVTYIGYGLFWNSKSLEEVRLPSGLEVLESNLFNNCQSLKSVQIPESVTNINNNVFEGCTALTNITLPQGLVSIGNSAFYKCSALQTLDIPKSVNRIYAGAFSGCKQLSTLYIRGVLESFCMNRDLFSGMGKQVKLYVPSSEVEKYQAIYDGEVFALADQKDYESLLSESKVWTMAYKAVVNPEEFGDVYHFTDTKLVGDTIINDIHFKQKYSRTWILGQEDIPQWQATDEYLGQDGGKIYQYFDRNKMMVEDMDMSLNIGDKTLCYDQYDEDKELPFCFIATAVSDTILNNTDIIVPRKSIHVHLEDYPADMDIWIDGIGSVTLGIDGLGLFHAAGAIPKLYKVTDGEAVIYQSVLPPQWITRPLVQKGKKWTYHHNTYPVAYDYYYTLEGDTVIAGKDCLMMYSENKDNTGAVVYEGALYEEDLKVYCFYPEKNEAELLYDFGCEVGDKLNRNGYEQILLSAETIEMNGRYVKRFDFQAQTSSGEDDPFVIGTISCMEGIGSTLDFFNMLPLGGNYNHLKAFEVNGEIIYQDSDLVNDIRTVSKKQKTGDAIFNLQGRRLSAPVKGINIIRQSDGTTRKVIVK